MEIVSNKRFLSLKWEDDRIPWQNVLAKLDERIEHFPSLCINSFNLYFIFGLESNTLFLARSISGHLWDYCCENLCLIDFESSSILFHEGRGEEIFDDQNYFSHLRNRKNKGFVEIKEQREKDVYYYIFRESGTGSLPLKFI